GDQLVRLLRVQGLRKWAQCEVHGLHSREGGVRRGPSREVLRERIWRSPRLVRRPQLIDPLAQSDPGRGLRYLLRPPLLLDPLQFPAAHSAMRSVASYKTA